jgi:hypothetical protein
MIWNDEIDFHEIDYHDYSTSIYVIRNNFVNH